MHGSDSEQIAISAVAAASHTMSSFHGPLNCQLSSNEPPAPSRKSPTPSTKVKIGRKSDNSSARQVRPVSSSTRHELKTLNIYERQPAVESANPELETPTPAYCPPTPVAFPVFSPQYMYSSVPTLYGQLHPHPHPGSIIIYTSAAIPPNTTSIILIPPSQVTTCPNTTGLPEDACSSTADGTSPLTILIERNAFKQWLDQNVPESVSKFPRLKRYKSVETFMRWITARKKNWDIPLTIIMRVTEVRNLLSELGKEFPSSIISQKILRNIYAYEHLFSLSSSFSEIGGPKLTARWSPPEGINISHCLDDACKLALLTQL